MIRYNLTAKATKVRQPRTSFWTPALHLKISEDLKMKLCCVVAVAVLVVALCSQAQSQSIGGPDECCFNYYLKPIPARQVKSYKTTNPNCPTKGVIFITMKDKKVCANPEGKQVQDIMEKLDQLWDPEPTTSSR